MTKKIPVYYSNAPFSWDTHDRIPEKQVTKEHNVIAWEDCNGGDGRCKCAERCRWAIVPKTKPEEPTQLKIAKKAKKAKREK